MNPSERTPLSEIETTRYLYKGLDTRAFSYYFRDGGINPNNPQYPWITEYWVNAEGYSLFYRAREVGFFSLAMIDRSVLRRGKIVKGTSMSGLETGKRVFDFYGDDRITWEEVIKIFLSQESLDSIERAYQQVQPDVTWDEFMEKVVLLNSDGSDFEEKLHDALISLA